MMLVGVKEFERHWLVLSAIAATMSIIARSRLFSKSVGCFDFFITLRCYWESRSQRLWVWRDFNNTIRRKISLKSCFQQLFSERHSKLRSRALLICCSACLHHSALSVVRSTISERFRPFWVIFELQVPCRDDRRFIISRELVKITWNQVDLRYTLNS